MIFFVRIARFAGGHHIPLAAFASPGKRNEMIHRQIGRFEFPVAIMADAGAFLSLPPLRTPQYARLLFLFADLLRRHVKIKLFFHEKECNPAIDSIQPEPDLAGEA